MLVPLTLPKKPHSLRMMKASFSMRNTDSVVNHT